MRTKLALTLIAVMSLGIIGCKFAKRGPDKYRDDTRALLETKSAEVKACYDAIVRRDQSAVGTVSVFFVLEKDTGVIKDAKVQDGTAPQAVQDCLLNSFAGLQLDPPDADDGHATFTWEFEVQQGVAPKSSGFNTN